jgi:ferredoxin--NADP+ reductase
LVWPPTTTISIEQRGFHEGNTSTPGHFVIERAFAEQ